MNTVVDIYEKLNQLITDFKNNVTPLGEPWNWVLLDFWEIMQNGKVFKATHDVLMGENNGVILDNLNQHFRADDFKRFQNQMLMVYMYSIFEAFIAQLCSEIFSPTSENFTNKLVTKNIEKLKNERQFELDTNGTSPFGIITKQRHDIVHGRYRQNNTDTKALDYAFKNLLLIIFNLYDQFSKKSRK